MDITVNGLKINYVCKGSGKTVLLLHGWGANIDIYDNILSFVALGDMYRAVACDIPGFGKSQEPDLAWDTDDYADFVTAFVQALKEKGEIQGDGLILIGHSHGGRIALNLSVREDLPFDIEKLILIDSAGVVHKKSVRHKLRLKLFKLGKTILKPFPKLVERIKYRCGSEDYKNASSVMRESLVKVIAEDYTDRMGSIKVPVLLVWGDADTATPISDGRLMESLIPGSGLAVIQGAGHYSFLDNAYTFNRIIGSFLKIKG